MTLGLSSSKAIKIKTDSPGLRAVECACCSPQCSCPQQQAGIVLTEEEYNNFQQGGNYTMTATLSEDMGSPYTCSSNLNGSGTLLGGCYFSSSVSEPKCSNPVGFNSAYLYVSWNVCKEDDTGIYKLHYRGDAACPYDYGDYAACYSVGYFIREEWDYQGSSGSVFVPIGTVTINNRGSQVQFNIWSFPNIASANGTITITPLAP